MTMSMAAVCVLNGAHTDADLAAALSGRFQAVQGVAAWDVPSVAGGRLLLKPSPVGLDVLVLRFSGTTYYSDADSIEAALADLLSGGERLGLLFAYVTRYEHEFDERWVEENVLLPLLMDQPERIPLESFERVLISPRPIA
ncbi:MAG: hypothetical protein IPL61_37975 [Myxococcales bacterium]|nr:hypothetical protein [Myxococcales bacterium]